MPDPGPITGQPPIQVAPASPSSRDKILEVAEALFARRGFAGVGMREVAEAAGLGKSSLFHHFRSKVQLYLAVQGRVLERMAERLGAALRGPGGTLERLDAWIDALVDALAEHPASARLLLRGLFEDEDFDPQGWEEGRAAAAHLETVLREVRALLRRGAEAGELRPASSAHTLQTLIGATVYHFASGEFGEGLCGAPLLSAEAVRRRKAEVKALVHHGLASPGAFQGGSS